MIKARLPARMFRLAGFLSLFALFLAGCAGKSATPRPQALADTPGGFAAKAGAVGQGTFLDRTGRPLAGNDLSRAVAPYDYILVGESHPSACDHAAQAAVLAALLDAGKRPAIGLEMVDVSRQDMLAAFHAGKLAVADLPRALDWEKNWGFSFSLYAPIFELAARHGLPVYALNLPSELARRAGARGVTSLSPSENALLPGQILPAGERATQRLTAFFAEHAAMMPKSKASPAGEPSEAARERLHSFLTVQALWDTQMAFAAVAAHARSGRPALILAGGGHVEFGDGIAARIRRLDPDAAILTIMPWRGGLDPEPEEADLFFYCPLVFQSRLGFSLEMAETGGKSPSPALVTAVTPGSRAETAGVLPGDAIVSVAGRPVSSLLDLHKAAMDAGREKIPLRLTVLRGGESLDIAVELPKRP
ncbi:PDZ domain-containing protein [Desulfovibrio sulfodismutans]|uniref:PDZ domain-containing protein n=1 Tax=Desulfolutivibrio sulfodismutans TaxID=63561 RepID=A0A7K3NNH7_9BACT|nr:ChaN family lipoprotein [Desulfolutivibrio sulfodismutans]NDY57748.1 PDZ domain-containing protein [Desulfolutivibrio sulfodismutans]QLA11563.1 PDZ domain-containing protein [Desulfolutivibrio sulfodismutans DSM 3696]